MPRRDSPDVRELCRNLKAAQALGMETIRTCILTTQFVVIDIDHDTPSFHVPCMGMAWTWGLSCLQRYPLTDR